MSRVDSESNLLEMLRHLVLGDVMGATDARNGPKHGQFLGSALQIARQERSSLYSSPARVTRTSVICMGSIKRGFAVGRANSSFVLIPGAERSENNGRQSAPHVASNAPWRQPLAQTFRCSYGFYFAQASLTVH